MKKIIIGLILLILSLGTFWGCGGGAGSPSSPSGENHGVPSIVQLQPSHFIAQTNTSITLHAKVLDGNGAPVVNTLVTFTNLSPIGVLSSTTAKTNNTGIATVTLKSTTDGFSTVQAEVSKDVGQARDRKTVFFSSINVGQPVPTLDLTVSGHGDPFVLFEPGVPNDDEVTVTATVFDGFGRRIVGIDVLFGSDSSEATFPLGSIVSTDTNGQASVLVKVVPSTLRSLPTTINITALAANGAFNMVSLFLEPVFIPQGGITVSANPQTVASGGTSTITAQVLTNAGTPVPDGTTVNFKTTKGGIDPFAQTTNGLATATYTAPTVSSDTPATITASVGAVSGSVSVTITAPPLSVTSSVTINGATGGTATFKVSGGRVPYTITSSNSAFPPAPTSVTVSGGAFTVIVPSGTAATTVTYTVQDGNGSMVTATLVINTAAGVMTVAPLSAAICENSAPCAGATSATATFTITDGTAPFVVTTDNNAVITSPVTVTGNTFTVDAINSSITANTIVTLTITDSAATPATVTRAVTVVNQP